MKNPPVSYRFKTCVLPALALLLSVCFWETSHGAASDNFAGTYSGSLNGDIPGIWLLFVESSGEVEMITWYTDSNTVESGGLTLNATGTVSGTCDQGTWIEATITAAGQISGTYSSSQSSGPLEGTLQTQVDEYEGTYAGVFSGDESGTWELTILPSGRLTGTRSASESDIVVDLMGGINAQGELIASNRSNHGMYALFDGGSVNGIWFDSQSGAQGAMSGNRHTNNFSSEESDASSGGCFISALLR